MAAGGEPRDLSERCEWRERTDLFLQEELELYGTYLVGQTNGLSSALSLQAVEKALNFELVPAEARAPIVQRLLLVHRCAVEIWERRRPKGGSHAR